MMSCMISKSKSFARCLYEYCRQQVHRLLMAAVENDNNNQLPSNKELQETCHHINIKHRVWIPFVIKRFIVFVTHQASKKERHVFLKKKKSNVKDLCALERKNAFSTS